MSSLIRPCISCGRANAATASACDACGVELSAWAKPAGVASSAREGLSGTMRQRRTILIAILGAMTFAAMVVRLLTAPEPVPTGPSWTRPHAMESWVTSRMRRSGVTPRTLRAVEETVAGNPRRLLIAEHPARQPLPAIVRAAAEVLLAARSLGEAASTHVYVIEQVASDSDPPTRVLIPVGDAAALVRHPAEVARLLGIPLKTEVTPEAESGDATGVLMAMDAGAGLPDYRDRALPATDPREVPLDPREIPLDPREVPLDPREIPLEAPSAGATQHAEARGPVTPSQVVPSAAGQAGPTSIPAVDATPAPAADTKAAAASATAKLKPPAAVRVQRGPGGPLPRKASPGDSGVVLMRVQVHPSTKRSLLLTQVSFKASGTVNDVEDIEFLNLIQDVDRDGKRGGADRLIGASETFGDDDGNLTFTGLDLAFGTDGQPIPLLLLADFGETSEGGTLQLTMPATGGVVVQDVATTQTCPATGVPLSNAVLDLAGNVAPDPEQERLDSLAKEGPDAIDENLKR